MTDQEYYIGSAVGELGLHLTISFMGKCDTNKLNKVKQEMKELENSLLPTEIYHKKEIDFFGKEKNVEVVKIYIKDEFKYDIIKKLYCNYGDRTDQFFDKERGPNLHISLNGKRENFFKNNSYELSNIYIRKLGAESGEYEFII